jgi:hypothetical protein
MNRDGQMNQILKTEYAQFASKFKSVAFGDGMPASAKWVREGILANYDSSSKKVSSNQKSVTSKKAAPAKKVVTKKLSAKKVTISSSKGKKAVTGKTVKKANRK